MSPHRFTDYNFFYNRDTIVKASRQLSQKFDHKWESLIGLLDLFILSRCDFTIATHSSNFGRLVYEFMHVNDPDPFIRFKSMDKDYFIHGYKSILLEN